MRPVTFFGIETVEAPKAPKEGQRVKWLNSEGVITSVQSSPNGMGWVFVQWDGERFSYPYHVEHAQKVLEVIEVQP